MVKTTEGEYMSFVWKFGSEKNPNAQSLLNKAVVSIVDKHFDPSVDKYFEDESDFKKILEESMYSGFWSGSVGSA